MTLEFYKEKFETLFEDITDSETGEIVSESSTKDQISDHYNLLSERLETLETLEISEDFTDITHDFRVSEDLLTEVFDRLETLESEKTLYLTGLFEDLEDLRSESDKILDSLKIVKEIDSLIFLCLTPVIIEDFFELEDRPEINYLITAGLRVEKTSEILEDLRDQLSVWRDRLGVILTAVSQSHDHIEEIVRSQGIVIRLGDSDHGLSISEIQTLESRIMRSVKILTDCLSDLESYSETLTEVKESVSHLRDLIETRQKRLTLRYWKTKDQETKDIISDSLKERVGVSFLDSGGSPVYDPDTGEYLYSKNGYGRSFEKNRSRDFDSEERVSIEIGSWGLSVSINVYHFLKDCLEYDPMLDSLFVEYSQTPDLESRAWFDCQDSFFDSLKKIFDLSGIYGENDPVTVNTYNHESLLSQTLQYKYFTIDQESRVSLQIHNGSDVRGGYTRPVIYYCSDYDQTGIFNDQRLWISTHDPETGETVTMYTDDSWHIYIDQESSVNHLPYNLKTRDHNMRDQLEIKRLEEKISSLESIIKDHITWRDPDSETDQKSLIRLLEIRDRVSSSLEVYKEKYKYNRTPSLSFDSFKCIEESELIDHDLTREIDSPRPDPIITFRQKTDSQGIVTGETDRLKILGLGDLYFDFYVD